MYKFFTAKHCRKPRFYLGKILLTMKAAVWLTFVFMQTAVASRGQDVSIEVKGAPVTTVLFTLSQQSGYDFIYDAKLMDDMMPITLIAYNEPLESVLKRCFEGQDFTFIFNDDNTIVIKKQETQISNTIRQSMVRGRVSDSVGRPLQGVSIQVKGTSTGTATDANGAFQIAATAGQTLVFSNIGYELREIRVGSQQNLTVVLMPVYSDLDEVVVTALGISREKRSLSYSAQNIGADDISEAKETNVINSLQGKVAGLTITRNATGPGGESKVLLRGNRSITNSNQPLYIVDGVPLNGNVEMLNADNIESMTVLKGASAAALYGSQGQNGAIIITTKKGVAGQTFVNYVGGVNLDQAAVLPELQYEYGQGDEGIYSASSENSWGPKADGQMVTLWNGNSVPLTGQPDRLEDFFRTATTVNNSISINGGGEDMQAYFAYGNTAAQGIIRNNDLIRHNIDLKLDKTVLSKLTFSTKLTYIYEDVDNRVSPGDAGTYILPSIYSAPVTIPLAEMQDYAYMEGGIEKQSYWKPGSSVLLNPYWSLNRVLNYQKKDRVLGLFAVKYDIADWLNVQLRGSMDKTIQKSDRKIYADSYFSQVGSNYEYGENRSQGINVDALLSFNRQLSSRFTLSGNLGASLQERKYESMSGNATGLNKPNYFFMGNAKAPIVTNGFGRSPRVQSLYGVATLAYRDQLFLDVTARNDWSSALPSGQQSYFYPSFGLSAIVSDMLALPSWVSYGKVRLTYANSGYGGTEYLDRNYYSVGPGGSIITPTVQSLGTYKPELTTSYEIGLDWRFFNNRLNIDATYYNTATKNQLLLIGLPPATLFDEKYINAGLIKNQGVEVSANMDIVRGDAFSWNAAVNYAKNVNKVERLTEKMKSVVLADGDNVYLVMVEEGRSYGDMYVRGWQTDEQGRKLVENDGTPILTDGLDVYIGNYNPDYTAGLTNTFSYKDFSLRFLIDHRQGGAVISGTQALIDAYGHSRASLNGRESGIVLDAYTRDGQRNEQPISSQKYYSLIGGRYPSAGFYSYSGTNTRLREVVLSYQLPAQLLGSSFIKNVQLSLVGRNLFFIHRVAPIDPEITRGLNGEGREYASLPSTRTFGFNLNVTF